MYKPTSHHIEKFLVFTLSGFAASIFFSHAGMSIFGGLSITALLLWRYGLKDERFHRLPRTLVIITVLYLLSFLPGFFVSEKPFAFFTELRKYRHFLMAGLLFIAPMNDENRKKVIIVLFLSAAVESLIGIFQHYGIFYAAQERPVGLTTHPIHYAGKLAFVCGVAILMLFFGKRSPFQTNREIYFLLLVAGLTFAAIILSQSRGVWVALVFACVITLFLYGRRKGFIFLIAVVILFVTMFSISPTLRQKGISIVTSSFNEDETGSMGGRFEMWKGVLLIFKDNPILGTGIGDYQHDIEELITQKRIKPMWAKMHAHNVFFQALATRGLVGISMLLLFFVVLISFGLKRIKHHPGIGGYVIILSVLLTIIGGLTENNLDMSRFLGTFSLMIGLVGSYGGTNLA